MASLVLFKNPLCLHEREVHPLWAGDRPIDWLQTHYPNGCGAALRYFVNGEEQDLADLDRPVVDGDLVQLFLSPVGPAIGAIIITALITAVISAAISLALALIFQKPKAPAFAKQESDDKASNVYDVNLQQNTARIGQPIPVIYGQVLMTPDYGAQPYAFYSNNEAYADALLVLGVGEFDIGEILIGDSTVANMDPTAVQYKVIPASVHLQAGGNLGFLADFYENVVTCPEVQQQEFSAYNQAAGPFRLSKAGVTGRYVQIDLVFPGGIYGVSSPAPNLTPTTISFAVYVREVDANGNPFGAETVFNYAQSLYSGRTPYRLTQTYDMGRSSQWSVRLVNLCTAQQDVQNQYNWTGLKLIADMPAGRVYGPVTLMAVRMRATRGITGSATSRIRVRLVRRLPPLGSGALLGTASPIDAFIDMYCNSDYGARRPLSEIDMPKMTALRYWYGPDYRFSAAYTARSTVWEALAQALQGVCAAPLPLGGLMSIAQDGVRPARSMLFSEQNIVRRSFALGYDFDQPGAPDGMEVEFVEPATWAPAYTRFPLNSVDPERMNLFGCTDETHAAQFARLQWQRRTLQRRVVDFATEREGLIPYPGERIGVAHTLPRWGISGFVAGVEADGRTIVLDRPLPWTDIAGPYYMAFRDQDGGMSDLVAVVRGSGDAWAVLQADPWASGGTWHLGERQEGTHFVWGDATRVVKDFTLTGLAPKSETQIAVSGVIYNAAVFDNTLAFLQTPVPA